MNYKNGERIQLLDNVLIDDEVKAKVVEFIKGDCVYVRIDGGRSKLPIATERLTKISV